MQKANAIDAYRSIFFATYITVSTKVFNLTIVFRIYQTNINGFKFEPFFKENTFG